MTLSADAGGYKLPPETYAEAGNFTYSRHLDPAAVETNILPVKFSFDIATKPSASEARELGAVITSAGLSVK